MRQVMGALRAAEIGFYRLGNYRLEFISRFPPEGKEEAEADEELVRVAVEVFDVLGTSSYVIRFKNLPPSATPGAALSSPSCYRSLTRNLIQMARRASSPSTPA